MPVLEQPGVDLLSVSLLEQIDILPSPAADPLLAVVLARIIAPRMTEVPLVSVPEFFF
jgi:hypothetical protein